MTLEGYYAYGDELDQYGLFQYINDSDFYEVFKFDLITDHNLDKHPQLGKLPQLRLTTEVSKVNLNVKKQPIYVVNNIHFRRSSIVFYDGMTNVFGISTKNEDGNIIDITDEEFLAMDNEEKFIERMHEAYIFRTAIVERIQHALRISRGIGNSLSGVSLSCISEKHLMLIQRYAGTDIIRGEKYPGRVLKILKEQSIFPDIIPQNCISIRCPVVSLIPFLGERYYYYPIVAHNYSIGGFDGFYFSSIPISGVVEFILDLNSGYMQVKAKMVTLPYSEIKAKKGNLDTIHTYILIHCAYVMILSDSGLERVKDALFGKTFEDEDTGVKYIVVYVERIYSHRVKKGKLQDNYRIWMIDELDRVVHDEPLILDDLSAPGGSVYREYYCLYTDDCERFDDKNLIIRSAKKAKEPDAVKIARRDTTEHRRKELAFNQSIKIVRRQGKRQIIPPSYFSPESAKRGKVKDPDDSDCDITETEPGQELTTNVVAAENFFSDSENSFATTLMLEVPIVSALPTDGEKTEVPIVSAFNGKVFLPWVGNLPTHGKKTVDEIITEVKCFYEYHSTTEYFVDSKYSKVSMWVLKELGTLLASEKCIDLSRITINIKQSLVYYSKNEIIKSLRDDFQFTVPSDVLLIRSKDTFANTAACLFVYAMGNHMSPIV